MWEAFEETAASNAERFTTTGACPSHSTTELVFSVPSPPPHQRHIVEPTTFFGIVNYLALYIAHCTLKMFTCDYCMQELVKADEVINNEKELLIMNRDFAIESEIKYLTKAKWGDIFVVKMSLEIFD